MSEKHEETKDDEENEEDEEVEGEVEEYFESNVIYRDSNFWQRYRLMAESVRVSNDVKKCPVNEYFSRSFLDDFLKKYIAYLPLASSFVLSSRDQLKRSNNGPIEGYFGITKNKLRSQRKELGIVFFCILDFGVFLCILMYLGVLGQLKISRYVHKQEKMVKDTINEYNLSTMPSQIHKKHKPRKSKKQSRRKSKELESEDLTQDMLLTQEESWRKNKSNIVEKTSRFGDPKKACEKL